MNPRLYVEAPEALSWRAGHEFDLPALAARHAQVLRLQAGSVLTLFNGSGGQWSANILHMGRRDVTVRLVGHEAVERELPVAVTLAVCMPANDRMDDLVEKATELGAMAIVPLISERSVLKLSGERAAKRQAHWQAVAVAASEQCGRNRVPQVQAPQGLDRFLEQALVVGVGGAVGVSERLQLSLAPAAAPLAPRFFSWSKSLERTASAYLCVLSGPEGGLTAGEQAQAQAAGYRPVSLGPRTLRADTAPLAALAAIGAWTAQAGVGS
jgi:16S rRNA (uracil1498-N3)-methyltransferase